MPYRLKRDTEVSWMLAALPTPCGLIMALLNERFTSRSWRFAGGMPGGYAWWGGILIVLGLAMLATLAIEHVHSSAQSAAAFTAALFMVGLWWVLLGGLFIYTSYVDSLANPLGGLVWLWLGLLYWNWARHERRRI